ncbi:MAG: methyltransferase domain-containing protein, partial [Clostridia bacterium]
MRLRKKKFLSERIDEVNDLLLVDNKLYIYDKPEEERFERVDLAQTFGNNNPVWLEIGCGKGKFVCEMATKYPNINFIAVERVSNVIVSACERAFEEGLQNVRFVICMAENLYYYLPQNSISRIYLNFSCPYPKHTYANRR